MKKSQVYALEIELILKKTLKLLKYENDYNDPILFLFWGLKVISNLISFTRGSELLTA